MTNSSIGATEPPLSIFISSRQDDESFHARELAADAVRSYPGVRVWAFEGAPASSETARDRYIRNAGQADIVIWLIGSTTSRAVVEEVNACMVAHGRLLVFKLPAAERDEETEKLIEQVQGYATWKEVENIERSASPHWRCAGRRDGAGLSRSGSGQPRPVPEAETPGEHRGY